METSSVHAQTQTSLHLSTRLNTPQHGMIVTNLEKIYSLERFWFDLLKLYIIEA